MGMALSTGLGATAIGYFIQGWFKFGGVEFFKIQAVKAVGDKKAWDNRTAIYLGAAAGAEFIADCFLCPLEACRIRSVSDPGYAATLPGVAARLIKEEGVLRGFYSGFGPILFKQSHTQWLNLLCKGAPQNPCTAAWALHQLKWVSWLTRALAWPLASLLALSLLSSPTLQTRSSRR